MIVQQMYLSNTPIETICEITNLAEDEVLSIVGVFAKQSSRAGQMRGELVEYVDGTIIIRHHFTKKVLWRLL